MKQVFRNGLKYYGEFQRTEIVLPNFDHILL